MDWLEKKLGRYAIRNLSLVLIMCYACGYIIRQINANFLLMLTLDPYAILHGQIWRLVTWLIVPPDSSNIFFVLIMLLFYYQIGTALERTWGTWRYNVYIFGGMLCTIIGAFLMMGFAYLIGDPGVKLMGGMYFRVISIVFSTYYVNMSIFLAYAATFPEAVVLLFFILPVKTKWLGIAYGALLAYDFVKAAAGGAYYLCFAMAASLANFFIFFVSTRMGGLSFKEWKRRRNFKKAMRGSSSRGGASGSGFGFGRNSGNNGSGFGRNGNNNGSGWNGAGNGSGSGTADGTWHRAGEESGNSAGSVWHHAGGNGSPVHMNPRGAIHRCAICGRTELDDPNLEFRYCSKCEGNYEFCQDHLFLHIHAKDGKGPQPMQVEKK